MISPKMVRALSFILTCLAACITLPLRAGDVIELANGDRYQGRVISMTESNVEFQSEVQGRLTLPRAKVARITLGDASAPKPATRVSTRTNAPSLVMSGSNVVVGPGAQSEAVARQMQLQGVDPKIVTQVQEQVLAGGSPEASQKFNELMSGLTTGKLSVQDIQAQARDSIAQIKDLKKDLGDDDVSSLLDGYLSILEKFVNEPAATTNEPAPVAPTPVVRPAVRK